MQAKGSGAKTSYRDSAGGRQSPARDDALLGIKLFLGYKPMLGSYRI